MELLMRNPHPHTIRYRGCLIKLGRIVGLVLDRYPMTLKQRLEKGARHFNVEDYQPLSTRREFNIWF